MQHITLIAAVGRDGAIGRDGALIWHNRDDMRHFRERTMGRPVVMGRATFESLPAALPGRRNIVLTRRADYRPEGAVTAPDLASAIAMCAGEPEVMIIGGGQVYEQAMPLATQLEITLVDADTPDADTHFPAIDPAVWQLSASAPRPGFSFLTYTRSSNPLITRNL